MKDERPGIKSAAEYPLPASAQTHEIVSPDPRLLLISQQPDSALVKVAIDPETGRPLSTRAHTIGSPSAGLHGLCVSRSYPGQVWATLQFESEIVRLDPVADDPDAPPVIVERLRLPPPAAGPHVVVEDGSVLWVSCKDSHHVVRLDGADPGQALAIPTPPRPIFVAVHPTTGDCWASLDQASALFRVPRVGSRGELVPIPAERGATPVGLIAGPDGGLWAALLGGSGGGTGTLARVRADGALDFVRLTSGAGRSAAFIHLAFGPRLYALASSMGSMSALDAVIALDFSDSWGQVACQQVVALPSQPSMTHRLLCTPRGLYVTGLSSCTVAHLTTGRPTVDERSDAYALRGYGAPGRGGRL